MPDRYLIVFEDEFHGGFYPISLSRPVYHILAGTKTNIERVRHHFGGFNIIALCRSHLSEVFAAPSEMKIEDLMELKPGRLILVNGRAVFRQTDQALIREIENRKDPVCYLKDGVLVAAVLSGDGFKDLYADILSLYSSGRSQAIIAHVNHSKSVDLLVLSNIWDPVALNPELLESDFDEYFKGKSSGIRPDTCAASTGSEIYAGDNVTAQACTVIDARQGPVIIGSDVEIKPFTYIEGPAYIGDRCMLVGGKITGGCSVGSGCRIGGELENTVILANSNKYHLGFMGHAYIGEWVNLGALATNSDLKNNYTEVAVKQNGVITRTGKIKIGSFIGDHSKIGIGVTLNTGAVIGFCCNLFGGALITEKEIPSFTFGNDSIRRGLSLSKAMETAEIVMGRRGFRLDEGYRRIFKQIFDDSAKLRKAWSARS